MYIYMCVCLYVYIYIYISINVFEGHGSQGASSSGYPSSAPAATPSAAPPVESRLPPINWLTREIAFKANIANYKGAFDILLAQIS